jgi:hypothetical protein
MGNRDDFDETDVADEVPVADAVEQGQETAPEPGLPDRAEPPIEANTPDWQEQGQEIVGADDDRRDDHPE